jgi:hypothetical protein
MGGQSSGIGDPREERPMFHVKHAGAIFHRAGKPRRLRQQRLTLSSVKTRVSLTNEQFPGTSRSNGQIFDEIPYILY